MPERAISVQGMRSQFRECNLSSGNAISVQGMRSQFRECTTAEHGMKPRKPLLGYAAGLTREGSRICLWVWGVPAGACELILFLLFGLDPDINAQTPTTSAANNMLNTQRSARNPAAETCRRIRKGEGTSVQVFKTESMRSISTQLLPAQGMQSQFRECDLSSGNAIS
eukprot:1826900-Rhodomonas_salina.1